MIHIKRAKIGAANVVGDGSFYRGQAKSPPLPCERFLTSFERRMFIMSFVLTFMETFFYWTMLTGDPNNDYGYVNLNVYLINLVVLVGILGVQYLHFYCCDSLGFHIVMMINGLFMVVVHRDHPGVDHLGGEFVGGKFVLQ